jgi:protoporphyrinogen oxidase
MDGKYIGYPLENYLHQLDKGLVSKVLDDFLSPDYKPRDPFSYPHFEAFLISNFGSTLYELYFRPYNEKIWNTDLSRIPLTWLEGKLPMPNLKEMLLSNIVVQEETEMVHATFFYAKEGGSQFIADRLARDLDIELNTAISQVRKDSAGFRLNGKGYFKNVIYTGDVRKIDEVFPDSVAAKILADQVRNLPSNGTSNVFCETDPGDISWLYLPGPEIKAHRIIYTGTFTPTNNRGSSRHTCVVEFSGKHDPEEMYSQLPKLPGNLTPLAWNYEPNSYIIHLPDTRERIDQARIALEQEGIFLLGRFAEWEYYNMDKAIEAAMSLAKKLNARL